MPGVREWEEETFDMSQAFARRPAWFARAACRGMPVNLFFVRGRGDLYDPAARATCRECPVREECLDWAIAHHETGYWGGTTDHDRLRLRRLRRSARGGGNQRAT